MASKSMIWFNFSIFTLCLGGYLGYRFLEGDKRFLVPGAMTRGHYPIEQECVRCHTPMLGIKSDACTQCHATELGRVDDSHPRAKFEDPRNADRLAKLDARECVACHVEHRPELTGAMGVTQPDDVCANCHGDIANERPSHQGLAFSSCQDAGCHNFHDNRALNEDYLEKHLGDGPAIDRRGHVAQTTRALQRLQEPAVEPLTAQRADAPRDFMQDPRLIDDWAASAHARAGVNCQDCHAPAGRADGSATGFERRPGIDRCKKCHEGEAEGFLGSKHGMRIAVGLSPMRPAMARLRMQPKASHRELGCNSCHGAHAFDRKRAAVDACLRCHADGHSLAYTKSAHYRLWQAELGAQAPAGSGVSCATCHLPRAADVPGGVAGVQHNQNDFMRPVEKQIDSVCRHCHSVEFAIDALADPAVIAAGVAGRPRRHVRSMDFVREKVARVQRVPSGAP